MKRYKLTFEFDGSDFFGWQKQPDVRTVEEEIEKALSKLFQSEIDIIGQGRTDSGVHALKQVAHADLPEQFSVDKIKHAMQGLLPEDVSLMSIEEVHADFHARFDAIARSYSYRIATRPTPLYRHLCWPHKTELDDETLDQCSKMICGKHNFINFCIPSGDEYQTTDCIITESSWEYVNGFRIYKITGNRFLRHLVRRLVGTMAKVASGSGQTSDFKALLELKGETGLQVYTAPAKGLILENVSYQ